jgi:hypothetical protein
MTIRCPECGLINPESTLICDCGYEFKPGEYRCLLCTECGAELKGAQFCTNCGAARDRAVTPSKPPARKFQLPGFSISASADVHAEHTPAQGGGLSIGGRFTIQRTQPSGPQCAICAQIIADLSKSWRCQLQGNPVLICDSCYELIQERRALSAIMQIDTASDRCHNCGGTQGLTEYVFGMAKPISAKRDWTRPLKTAATVVFGNLISMPFGVGVFAYHGWTPGKMTSFRVVRAELVLCQRCTNRVTSLFRGVVLSPEYYQLHPWAKRAAELGYSTFLSADELSRLKPTS